MKQALTMVMLPTRDLAGIRTFYEAGLGWRPAGPPSELSVIYPASGIQVVFLDAAYLEKESGRRESAGGKIVLATFLPDKGEVDDALARAAAAGGELTSPARDRDLGIYSGYFADPEGNVWEAAWAPSLRGAI